MCKSFYDKDFIDNVTDIVHTWVTLKQKTREEDSRLINAPKT